VTRRRIDDRAVESAAASCWNGSIAGPSCRWVAHLPYSASLSAVTATRAPPKAGRRRSVAAMTEIPFPRTGAPAQRALINAGYQHLQQLDGVPQRDLLALHGMGPKAMGILRQAMAEHGWAFAEGDE